MQPHWNSAATRLKGKVKLGKVDATANPEIAKRYAIQSYPTIKVFPAGVPLDKAIDFEGGRTADTIETAALEYLKKYPAKKEVFQLLNDKVLESECTSKNGVCIIAFFPHLADTKAEGRKKYISILEEAAKKNTIYPLYYFWSQAYDQKALEKIFALAAGYPAVVGISPSKKKYSIMRRAYTVEGISSFLSDLMRGYERLNEYKELPKLADIGKWDGKDAPEPTSDL